MTSIQHNGPPGRSATRDGPARREDPSSGTSPPVSEPSSRRSDERAVSDLVGYILTVGVLLLAVGVVSTVGVDQIGDARELQDVETAERAVTLLAGNFEAIQESRASVRTSDISATTGQIDIVAGGGSSNLTINVSGTDVGPTDVSMGTLAYRVGETTVVYEGGAVILDDPRGSPVIVTEPRYLCSDGRAVVSAVTLQGPGANSSLAGGTASITARLNESRIHFPANRSGNDSFDESTGVNVTVNSEYEAAWETYFQDSDREWTKTGPSTYRCEAPSGTMPVYVRQTVLDVTARR